MESAISPPPEHLSAPALRARGRFLSKKFVVLRERDAREAMDDRTPAQQGLGDPPRWWSALGGKSTTCGRVCAIA